MTTGCVDDAFPAILYSSDDMGDSWNVEFQLDADPPTLPDADGNYPVAIPGVTEFV